MLGAYKLKGYGVKMRMAWSAFVFVVAAVLFVDNCNLVHMCVDPEISDKEFFPGNNVLCISGRNFSWPMEATIA
jgi:hypothetical protein